MAYCGATMMDCIRIRPHAVLVCAALLAPGCVIVSDDDTTPAESTTGTPDTNGDPATTATTQNTTAPQTTTGPDDGETTDDGFPENCSDNLVEDPGFEGGTPSEAWDEASEVWGTPICDTGCTEDPGAVPFAGEWFVWFGGLEDGQTDTQWVAQEIEIAPDTAHLRFRLAISGDDANGDNIMAVELDDETVFMVTDLDEGNYDGYQTVDVDVSAFADGQSHRLRFIAEFPGTVLTNFFLDEVELVSCADGDTTGTGTGTDTGTTSGTDSTTGDPDETGADETGAETTSGTTTGAMDDGG